MARVWHVSTWTMLACMVCMAGDLANSHTLCETVNVNMKTAINFYDMTTFCYLVIKEQFEYMCVIGSYFVWVAVNEALLFWVRVGYFVWVGGGVWGIIFGELSWLGHSFVSVGWVGISGGELGWVHYLIMPKNKIILFKVAINENSKSREMIYASRLQETWLPLSRSNLWKVLET